MSEKLSLKVLSEEMKTVLQRVAALEQQVETSMEATLEKARRTLECIRQQGSGPETAEERRRKVAEAAYYKAQQRGFQGGDPQQDWHDAEREIESRFH